MSTLMDHIDDIQTQLSALRIKPGDRIAFVGPTGPPLAAAIIACWRSGAVVVPMSTRTPKETLSQSIDMTDCRLVFASEAYLKVICDVAMIPLEPSVSGLERRFSGICWDQLDLELDQEASIVLTSGSGGVPKAVLHTLGNHYYSALGADENCPFTRDDVWLASLPMSHVSGLSLLMRALIYGGGIEFMAPKESLAQAIQAEGLTHLSLVPTQLKRLLADSSDADVLQRFKAILIGGAPCPTELVEQCVHRGLPIYLTYGCTEMASQVTTTPLLNADARDLNHSGGVLPHRELEITPQGEIRVRGLTLFKGYVTTRWLEAPFDVDGWFYTGDLGSLDAQGCLTVHGRKDTLFISGGENIYPEPIEKAILVLDGVEKCLVVPVESETYGKRPVAFVKMTDDILPERAFFQERLHGLESFRIPDQFYAWPAHVDDTVKVSRSEFIDSIRN